MMGDLGEGQAGAILGNVSVGGGVDGRVAQRPQEALLVHGEGGEGDRLLGVAFSEVVIIVRRLGSLPLGGAAIATTVSPIDGSSKLLHLGDNAVLR